MQNELEAPSGPDPLSIGVPGTSDARLGPWGKEGLQAPRASFLGRKGPRHPEDVLAAEELSQRLPWGLGRGSRAEVEREP